MMKAQLLSHAESLVRERGFDAFSYADLAKGADITKASVHHHFPTKAALFAGFGRTVRGAHIGAFARGGWGTRLQNACAIS